MKVKERKIAVHVDDIEVARFKSFAEEEEEHVKRIFCECHHRLS